jgi:uncharacterized membrane protein YfcA
MTSPELLLLAFIAFGAYVQSIAGFAMAMLAVALAAAFTPLPLPLVASTTMLAAFVNVVGGLHGLYHHVDVRGWRAMTLVQVPAVWLGLALLHWLSTDAALVLRLLLGTFITGAGLAMLLHPQPQPERSPAAAFAAVGGVGGVLNGMFAAGGPIAGWFLYRQPMRADAIRATLLAYFMVGSGTRVLSVAVTGGFDAQVLRLAAIAIPVTLVFTWLGRAFRPPLGEAATRRVAFSLLLVSGVLILVDAAGILR